MTPRLTAHDVERIDALYTAAVRLTDRAHARLSRQDFAGYMRAHGAATRVNLWAYARMVRLLSRGELDGLLNGSADRHIQKRSAA